MDEPKWYALSTVRSA